MAALDPVLARRELERHMAVCGPCRAYRDSARAVTAFAGRELPAGRVAVHGERFALRAKELLVRPDQPQEPFIRADFAASIEENVVHGSDAPETAANEIAFFFGDGLCPRTR